MRIGCAVIVLLGAPGMALGAVLQMRVGGSTGVEFIPGETIAIDICIEGAEVPIAAFDAFLKDPRNGMLSIVGRTFGPQGFGSFPTSPSVIGPLNPLSSAIGGLNIAGNVAPGDLGSDKPVETITVLVHADFVWGQLPCLLHLVNPILSDGQGNALEVYGSSLCIPEPASLLLLGIGAPWLRRRRG